MSDRREVIERRDNFVDLFVDAAEPTPDEVSVSITGQRLDAEEKIRAFFAAVSYRQGPVRQ